MVDKAVLDKLEAGFQKLQAATDCKSLLKKYLTKEVFDACKNRKTSLGATLLDVIQSDITKLWHLRVIERNVGEVGERA